MIIKYTEQDFEIVHKYCSDLNKRPLGFHMEASFNFFAITLERVRYPNFRYKDLSYSHCLFTDDNNSIQLFTPSTTIGFHKEIKIFSFGCTAFGTGTTCR